MKARCAVVAFGVLLLAGVACDSTLPQEIGDPTVLVKLEGDLQSDTAGAVLDMPLVVGAVSRLGRSPQRDVTVEWAVTSRGGAVSALRSTTDSLGLTAVLARLPEAGTDTMTVEASLPGRDEAVVFTAAVSDAAAESDSAAGP